MPPSSPLAHHFFTMACNNAWPIIDCLPPVAGGLRRHADELRAAELAEIGLSEAAVWGPT